MTEPQPEPATARRTFGPMAIALLAFVIGALAMAAIAWTLHWQPHPQTATPVAQPAPQPVQQPSAQPGAVDALSARELALAAQLQALEAQIANVAPTAAAASGQASRAEALLVAFAARRALDSGVGLGAIEPRLNAQFTATEPRAVATVEQVGRQPVTLEQLRTGLDALGPELVSGIQSEGLFGALRHEIGALVVIRHADAPSPRPADQLAEARALLAAGQADKALTIVARLPGARAASDWTNRARRYVEAHQALDRLEQAALALPVAPQPAPAAPNPAPADPSA